MKNQLVLVVSACLIITSCSKPNDNNLATSGSNVSSAANPGNQHKPGERTASTISGSLHYSATTGFDLPCSCGAYFPDGNYTGTGTLTHLGLSTSHIKPCVAPIYSGSATIGFHVGVECNTLAAANGDQLYCNILPYDIMFAGADAVGVTEVDITGGTGRFSGATGHFSGTVTVHLALGTADMDGIAGTINY